MDTMPIGTFTCDVTLQRIRSPQFVREIKDGVTYLTGRDYELAYETTLHFADGATLPIKARLFGELNQQVVIRDKGGTPIQTSGYVQGRAEICDTRGNVLFRGRYYDSRVVQSLTGDEALTATGPRLLEQHLENGLGEGAYAGHAFSLSGQLSREGDAPHSGQCHGCID